MKPNHRKARLKHEDSPKKAGKLIARRMVRRAEKQETNAERQDRLISESEVDALNGLEWPV